MFGVRLALLAAVVTALAGSLNGWSDGAAARSTVCAIPLWGPPDAVFEKRTYHEVGLTGGYIRPTRRYGSATPWVCQDTLICQIGPPVTCEPGTPTPSATIRVWKIRGIAPRLALSRGGSSRVLLVAEGRCLRYSFGSERRLLRCLRSAS